jgi:hypothetical protein
MQLSYSAHALMPRIPRPCISSLCHVQGVFEDGGVAELLTTDAISELSCLALYLMCVAPHVSTQQSLRRLTYELHMQWHSLRCGRLMLSAAPACHHAGALCCHAVRQDDQVHVVLCRYEKKRGEESFWHAYISELDRLRARGPLAAESPLIWTDDEVVEYLRGSPVQKLVSSRIASLREEYESLDTVW